MKIKVGQDFIFKGETKKYVHIIKVSNGWIEYKEYKSYKDKVFARMRDLGMYICYMTPEELFLKHYRPVGKKVRRIE